MPRGIIRRHHEEAWQGPRPRSSPGVASKREWVGTWRCRGGCRSPCTWPQRSGLAAGKSPAPPQSLQGHSQTACTYSMPIQWRHAIFATCCCCCCCRKRVACFPHLLLALVTLPAVTQCLGNAKPPTAWACAEWCEPQHILHCHSEHRSGVMLRLLVFSMSLMHFHHHAATTAATIFCSLAVHVLDGNMPMHRSRGEAYAPGLLPGLGAPVMTPNGIDFPFLEAHAS